MINEITDMIKIEPLPCIFIVKTISTEHKEGILKAIRVKSNNIKGMLCMPMRKTDIAMKEWELLEKHTSNQRVA
jgi:hypothetical protein